MVQKTTPELTFNIDFDLTGYDAKVYISQLGTLIVKQGTVSVTGNHSTVSVILTETETLSLMQGDAWGQVWATNGTDSIATKPLLFSVDKILDPSHED